MYSKISCSFSLNFSPHPFVRRPNPSLVCSNESKNCFGTCLPGLQPCFFVKPTDRHTILITFLKRLVTSIYDTPMQHFCFNRVSTPQSPLRWICIVTFRRNMQKEAAQRLDDFFWK